jgi:hypothetical protein
MEDDFQNQQVAQASSVHHSGSARSIAAIIVAASLLCILLLAVTLVCCANRAWANRRSRGKTQPAASSVFADSPKLVAKVADYECGDQDGSVHISWAVRSAAFESDSVPVKVRCLQRHWSLQVYTD